MSDAPIHVDMTPEQFSALLAAARDLDIVLNQRNEAIAEAAVLRHRDRRTQAVVEAAVAWRGSVASQVEIGPTVWHLVSAVDALQKGPETALSATESADQPPVEALATDGAGAEGEAQGAAEASWRSPVHTTSATEADGWQAIQGFVNRLRRDVELMQATFGEVAAAFSNTPMPPDLTPGSHMSMAVRTPRVWNAGDPEPEGVEKVADDDGDLWVRAGSEWQWTDDEGVRMTAFWDGLTEVGPLTEVLPEPAPVADNDHDPDGKPKRFGERFWLWSGDIWIEVDKAEYVACERAAGFNSTTGRPNEPATASFRNGQLRGTTLDPYKPPSKPDGEVPEAGRAGEAQEDLTVKAHRIASLIDAGLGTVTKPAQERTEGQDAAINAAWDAYRAASGPAGHLVAIVNAVRAASPLIERAALLAAADDFEDDPFPDIADEVKWIYVEALRDRAGRTVAS
jgi:hypothetical protein